MDTMKMINACNLSMGCFPIFHLHEAFWLYLYHGRVSLCLQYYIRLSVFVCVVRCDNRCNMCVCVTCV